MAASTSEDNAAVVVVPWLDLPEGLTEEIIGRLSVHDYVRFGAVCWRWGSIQRDHRLRHPPSSPPTVKIPWFIPYWPREESVVCSVGLHSAEERRLQIPFSPTYVDALESEGADSDEGRERPAFSSLPYGWLLFDDCPFMWSSHRSYDFCLLNPITGAQISLPTLGDLFDDYKATISPPPHSDVLIFTTDKWANRLFLYRQGDPEWTYLWDKWYSGVPMDLASVIYYDGKFYSFRLGQDFMAFDLDCPITNHFNPDIEPHFLEMDQSLLPTDYRPWDNFIEDRLEVFLVESNGRMLLVCKYFDHDRWGESDDPPKLVRFELFEADFSNLRWAKAECLGDQALIIYGRFPVSLTAADVGVRRNCIYNRDAPRPRNEQGPAPWKMFNLSTGELADASLPFPPMPSTHLMFVPSIY